MVRARGFTLVELLVALAVMALLAVMSWTALDGMTRARTMTKSHTDDVLTLQSGLVQWGADLDAMLEPGELPSIDWDGRALRLVRASGDGDATGPRVVAWTRRDAPVATPWLRWQSPVAHSRAELLQAWERAALWAQNPGTDELQREVAILPLTGWRIFYFRSGAWTNPLSSADVQAAPGSQGTASTLGAAPDGVRLQIDLAPGGALAGTLTRDWVRPTQGGGK